MSCKKTESSFSADYKKVTQESELSKLSSDPQLVKHPDPAFHVTYRDADELGEQQLERQRENPTGQVRKSASIASDWSLRRSQKE